MSMFYTSTTRRLTQLVAVTLVVLTSLMVTACSSSSTDEPEPVEPTQRTVLVYISSRNSLGQDGYDDDDIQEMLTAAGKGDLGKNRLILFHSCYNDTPAIKEITANGVVTLKSYDDDLNAVDGATMKQIIADVKQLAPANHYGLVLWSHGSGWYENGLTDESKNIAKRAFGEDRGPNGTLRGRFMNVSTLASVLDGENFDYVYFDCCFMACVEVAYELRKVTPTIVASVSELPSPGMPYDKTVKYLLSDNGDADLAAEETFNYYNAQSGEDRTCTMSVIKTDKLDALAQAVRNVYEMHPSLDTSVTVQQFAGMRSSYYNSYFDLADYLNKLADVAASSSTVTDVEALRTACNKAISAIDDCLTYKAATPYLWHLNPYGYEMKIDTHCGLSTYILSIPANASTNNYSNLQWYADVAHYIL